MAKLGNLTSDVAERTPFGDTAGRTNVFVLPAGSEFGAAGLAIGGGDFLFEGSFAAESGVESGLLAHEFAHTRQTFRTGGGLAWVTEGSARHYEYRYGFERRHRSFGQYREYVSVAGDGVADATLTEVGATSDAAYEKGAHVLTALDVLVRQRTDGEARVDDVLERMNAHEGEVSYDDFRSMVRAETRNGVDGWLGLYVRGADLPPLPSNASLVAPAGWESARWCCCSAVWSCSRIGSQVAEAAGAVASGWRIRGSNVGGHP